MPNCQSIDPLVTPYVDGELAAAQRQLVDDHVCVCALCRTRVAAEQAMRELVRGRAPQLCAEQAPDALRAACVARLKPRAPGDDASVGRGPSVERGVSVEREASAERPRSWRARLAPFALAASLVLIVGTAFLYQATTASVRVMAAELAADHVKCFAMNRILGTRHEAAHVESAMASGFAWRMHLPEPAAPEGLELVGARPCLYGHGKIAHIMYRHQGRPVSLFMLPESARAEQVVDVLGHQAAVWCIGNRTFVLVARESKREVERLASFVRRSLR